jgi:hypothetical protein
MMPDEQAFDLPDPSPDALSTGQARRLRLWRAMADLSNAQADGRLSPEQARLLEALAANLHALSARLSQLAALGQQYAQVLEAGPGPAQTSLGPRATDSLDD